VWDFTFERAECAVVLDVTLPIESGLNLAMLKRRLKDYPDRRLVSYLLEGVRLEANVELQTVLVPHLISLPKGFKSVRKELYRLAAPELDWYRFFDELPFWPIYLNGQGAASRKLEERYRRTTECGGPRKPCFDKQGIRALSLNEASTTVHMPQWFRDRQGEPLWDDWLHAKGLGDPSIWEVVYKWVKELKPTLTQVMRDISILLGAAHLLGEPIYVFGDDAKDYFNQLAISSEDWYKLGVVFLHDTSTLRLEEPASARLFFVSERRLGFGAKPSSNIAQRFSESLLFMLRQDMDAAEAAAPFDVRPAAAEWRRVRQALETTSDVHTIETRLYCVHMYTDDPIFVVVGVNRALRLLSCWHALTTELGLLMAIPEKRNLGTWAPWLGIIILAGLGLVIVPKAKLLRTSSRLHSALTEPTPFSEWRALMGMLEHLRCVNCAPASIMYGLYGPHRSRFVQANGPTTLVHINPFMAAQIQQWKERLSTTGGAPVTAALNRAEPQYAKLLVSASSDAATDSTPPGMGGFCHGLYWYLRIPELWLTWLHITALEMLATIGSCLAFRTYFESASQVVLQADALATPYVLSKHKAKSDALTFLHHEVLQMWEYQQVAVKAAITHLNGDCNPFADYISRGEWDKFFALCRASGIRPQQVPVPARLHALISNFLSSMQARGVPVSRSSYTRPAPILPPAMLGLGKHTSACEEADAVALSTRLINRINNRRTQPLIVATITPATGPVLSARLAARLQCGTPQATIMQASAAQVVQTDLPLSSTHARIKRERPLSMTMGVTTIAGLRLLLPPCYRQPSVRHCQPNVRHYNLLHKRAPPRERLPSSQQVSPIDMV
jgi:hypothetical protein